MKHLYTILLILFWSGMIYANPNTMNSSPVSNDDELIKRCQENYNKLLKQNHINDSLGLSHKNKYVFSNVDLNDVWYGVSSLTDYNGAQLITNSFLTDINTQLVEANTGSTEAEAYVLLILNEFLNISTPPTEEFYNKMSNDGIVTSGEFYTIATDEEVETRRRLSIRMGRIMRAVMDGSHSIYNAPYSNAQGKAKCMYLKVVYRSYQKLFKDNKSTGASVDYLLSSPKEYCQDPVFRDYIGYLGRNKTYLGSTTEQKTLLMVEAFRDHLLDDYDNSFVPSENTLNFESFNWTPPSDATNQAPANSPAYNNGKDEMAATIAEMIANYGSEYVYEEKETSIRHFHGHQLAGMLNSFGAVSEVHIPWDIKNPSGKFYTYEQRLAYLKEVTGIQFYIVFQEVNFWMDQTIAKGFAEDVYDKCLADGTFSSSDDVVLITLPYYRVINSVNNILQYPYIMPAIFSSDVGNVLNVSSVNNTVDSKLQEDNRDGKNLWLIFNEAYRQTFKPARIWYAMVAESSATSHLDEHIQLRMHSEVGLGGNDGLPFINTLMIYRDSAMVKKIKTYESAIRNACSTQGTGGTVMYSPHLSESNFRSCGDAVRSLDTLLINYEPKQENFKVMRHNLRIREKFLFHDFPTTNNGAGPALSKEMVAAQYTLHAIKLEERWFDKYLSEGDLATSNLGVDILLDYDTYDFIYDAVDGLSLALMFIPYGDNVTDVLTIIVGTIDPNPLRGSIAITAGTVGLIMPTGGNSAHIAARGTKNYIAVTINAVEGTPGANYVFRSVEDITDVSDIKRLYNLGDDAADDALALQLRDTNVPVTLADGTTQNVPLFKLLIRGKEACDLVPGGGFLHSPNIHSLEAWGYNDLYLNSKNSNIRGPSGDTYLPLSGNSDFAPPPPSSCAVSMLLNAIRRAPDNPANRQFLDYIASNPTFLTKGILKKIGVSDYAGYMYFKKIRKAIDDGTFPTSLTDSELLDFYTDLARYDQSLFKFINNGGSYSSDFIQKWKAIRGELDQLPDEKAKKLLDDLKNEPNFPDIANALESNPSLIKAWKAFDDIDGSLLRLDEIWLNRMKLWLDEGIELSSAGNSMIIVKYDIHQIGLIFNGKLLSVNYSPSFSGTTLVGSVTNACGLFTDGIRYYVKRIPDASSFTSAEMAILKAHPNAHCLEKHNFDVTDEALQWRGITGVAPNGQQGNVVHAARFNSAADIQLALTELGPGTPRYNAVFATITPGQTGFAVDHTFPNSMGMGYRKETLDLVPTVNYVLAAYKLDVTTGNYYLVTMYPKIL